MTHSSLSLILPLNRQSLLEVADTLSMAAASVEKEIKAVPNTMFTNHVIMVAISILMT
jgi:hypothetical protein